MLRLIVADDAVDERHFEIEARLIVPGALMTRCVFAEAQHDGLVDPGGR
jgi:hypothetical protein